MTYSPSYRDLHTDDAMYLQEGDRVQCTFYRTTRATKTTVVYTVITAELDEASDRYMDVVASGKGVGSIRFRWNIGRNFQSVRIGSKDYWFQKL